jgi:small subunit ribosomal protein S16
LAVKLRLRRMGKKKQPIYKVVAADTRSPRDGKFLEALGLYNPLTDPHTLEIKEDRVLYWLDNGAQPTNTVKSLLRQKGITLKRELGKKGLDAEKVEAELENWKKLKEASSKKKSVKKKSKKQASSEKSEDKAVEEKPVETVAEEKTAETVVEEKPAETVAKEVGSTEESKPEEKKTTEESTTEVKGAASEEKEVEKE